MLNNNYPTPKQVESTKLAELLLGTKQYNHQKSYLVCI